MLEEEPPADVSQDYFPKSETPNFRTHHVSYALIDLAQNATGHMDLTGRFPKRSSSGNEHVLVGYHLDANCTHGLPVKNRKGSTIAEA